MRRTHLLHLIPLPLLALLPLLSLSLASSACGTSSARGGGASDDTSNASRIIGGVDATSASLDAVGVVLLGNATTGKVSTLCTGTLVTPTAVLTAKHCAIQSPTYPNPSGKPASSSCTANADCASNACTGGACEALVDSFFLDTAPMYFGVGPDANAPRESVQLASVDVCDLAGGGFAGEGCDMAVYTLSRPITDVTPLAVADAAPPPEMVGKRLVELGYGTQDEQGKVFGTRKLGSLTLQAVSGQALHAVYPSLDAMLEAFRHEEGDSLTDFYRSQLATWYDEALLDGYELWAGGGDGDAQQCHGDSGGPLLALESGKLVVQGVASTVIPGLRDSCEPMGGSFATFGAAAHALVQRAVDDPCRALPAGGTCEGDVAVRCTTPSEGPRRVTRTDCAAALQHCVPPAPATASDGGATTTTSSQATCG